MSLFESGWVMLTQKFQDCVILSWLMISWILVCFHNMARFYWMIKYWSNASSSHWIGPLKFSLFMSRVNPCDYINRPPDWNELYLFTRNCFYRIICLIIFDPWFQNSPIYDSRIFCHWHLPMIVLLTTVRMFVIKLKLTKGSTNNSSLLLEIAVRFHRMTFSEAEPRAEMCRIEMCWIQI